MCAASQGHRVHHYLIYAERITTARQNCRDHFANSKCLVRILAVAGAQSCSSRKYGVRIYENIEAHTGPRAAVKNFAKRSAVLSVSILVRCISSRAVLGIEGMLDADALHLVSPFGCIQLRMLAHRVGVQVSVNG